MLGRELLPGIQNLAMQHAGSVQLHWRNDVVFVLPKCFTHVPVAGLLQPDVEPATFWSQAAVVMRPWDTVQ